MKAVHALAMVVATFALCACATVATQRADGWTLVWEDNFDRAKPFDTATWSKIPRGTSDWDRHMSAADECYGWRRGNVVLRGLRGGIEPGDTAPVVTGGIYTCGKRTFSDGRIEIRARLGAAKGAWPAIWMLPEEGAWPHGGEIDIMERLNGESKAYQTVHSHYTFNLGRRNDPPSQTTAPIDPDGYNTYAVELHSDSLVFSINGNHTMTYRRAKTDLEGQFPFDRPYYLLIDMQLGGSWVGAVDTTQLPVEMLVDYVRFYKRRR